MNGLFILGSSGEVAYLNDAQRDAITARTVATAAGRVPVLVGAIETTAKRVIDRALARPGARRRRDCGRRPLLRPAQRR